MRYRFGHITRVLAIVLTILFAGLAFPHLRSIRFPSLPAPSSTFDCDDCALAMYWHFESLGIEATPFIGNLKMDGEAYMESNHVWLLVKSGDSQIAYDWGTPRFDRQHYEGYIISLDSLLCAVAQDQYNSNVLPSIDQ